MQFMKVLHKIFWILLYISKNIFKVLFKILKKSYFGRGLNE